MVEQKLRNKIMNGITYDSSGVEANKNVLMAYNCKKTKDYTGVWFEIFEIGCVDPCASIYMGIADLKALATYLNSVAEDLENIRDFKMEKALKHIENRDNVVFHEFNPNEKHIDEY